MIIVLVVDKIICLFEIYFILWEKIIVPFTRKMQIWGQGGHVVRHDLQQAGHAARPSQGAAHQGVAQTSRQVCREVISTDCTVLPGVYETRTGPDIL